MKVDAANEAIVDQSKYAKIIDMMNERVYEASINNGQKESHVFYSAYEFDDDGLPINNLDKVAIRGRFIFVEEPDDYFGGGGNKAYRSKEVVDPTWLECAVMANEMIVTTNDFHHIFLEGVRIGASGTGHFSMGS